MDVNDLLEYYKIAKDSKSIKRVEELSQKRDEAEAKGDTSELANIDSELTNMESKIWLNILRIY